MSAEAQVRRQIEKSRADKARTANVDRATMSGITSDDRHVAFSSVQWAWIDQDTEEKVVISQILYMDMED